MVYKLEARGFALRAAMDESDQKAQGLTSLSEAKCSNTRPVVTILTKLPRQASFPTHRLNTMKADLGLFFSLNRSPFSILGCG